MKEFLYSFREDESGAVTVDWVVLTAAVVGLAFFAVPRVQEGTTEVSQKTGTYLKNVKVE